MVKLVIQMMKNCKTPRDNNYHIFVVDGNSKITDNYMF